MTATAELLHLADWGSPLPVNPASGCTVRELTSPDELLEEDMQRFIIEAAEPEFVPSAQALSDWIFAATLSDERFAWVGVEEGELRGLLLAEDLKTNPWSEALLVYAFAKPGSSSAVRQSVGGVIPGWLDERGINTFEFVSQPHLDDEMYRALGAGAGMDDGWTLSKERTVFQYTRRER